VIAAQGSGGNLNFYWQAIGAQGWNPEAGINEGASDPDVPPTVTQVGDTSGVSVGGFYYWQTIGAPSWEWNCEALAGSQCVASQSG
jgi:hypothetical protein